LGLALVIELGQTALRDQSATFDDALICAGGALLGLLAARRVLSGTTDQRGGRCQRPTD
jgi:glycopeptide antibiotics resistance protein